MTEQYKSLTDLTQVVKNKLSLQTKYRREERELRREEYELKSVNVPQMSQSFAVPNSSHTKEPRLSGAAARVFARNKKKH